MKEMRNLTGADIICECLIEQGVDTVFGYPGGAVLNIYDSLYNYSDKIHHVLTAHEQGASHAADGYARSTGRTGVVIATSGPGATNLVTGIATAYMDSVPMVAITGNVACSLLGLDSFQEVDITGITMPITKHNFIVKDVNKLADTLREAFYIAGSGRKGPVLVDVPKDITAQKADFANKPLKPYTVNVTMHQDGCIAKAAELIKNAERPFLYTGGGIYGEDGAKTLKAFAELIDAPVSSSLMGQGSFDETDSRYMGMLGMHGTKTAAEAIKNCDLFIGIGTRFSDRVIGNPQTFAPDAAPIIIQRTTGAYHGYMALILFVGYLGVIIYNLRQRDREKRVNIPWILAIGILVQFGWEAGLLLGGIRSAGFASFGDKLHTLIINSLLETNLGMPYVYFIFAAYSAKFTEQLRRRPDALALTERISENNRERVR